MKTNDNIPFLDLVTPHRELENELMEVVRAALKTAGFIGGKTLDQFENAFAAFSETGYCIGVNSGTDALRFALIAAGVGSGDVVITVPNTFIATTEAISQAGAVPEFVDVDERTYNMDAAKLRTHLDSHCTWDERSGRLMSRRSGKRVAAIIPVHLYGQMADMDAILELAERYQLVVIEDACQAHGAEYFSKKQNRWCKAGSMGHAAAFSFYPGKNLGACGEAGAITTNDEHVAKLCRQLRDHGQAQKYYHDVEGYNGRLDSIQAGFLSVKLARLAEWNTARREAATRYNQLFVEAGLPVVTPTEPNWSKAVYHLYVVRCDNRDRLRESLDAAGIGTGIHYPIPLHLQKAYSGLGYSEGEFPVAEKAALEIASLPMFPTITAEQQERVVRQMSVHMANASAAASD